MRLPVWCLFAAVLVFGMGPPQGALGAGDRTDITLDLETELHTTFQDGDRFYTNHTLDAGVTSEIAAGWRIAGIGRLFVDPDDRSEPGAPDQDTRSDWTRRLLIGDHAEAELRELYLSGELVGLHWTVGKQQIVWGKADGVRVLDLVNPLDLTTFILGDFEDFRIPLWAVRAEAQLGGVQIEGVMVPDGTVNDTPPPGGEFALTASRFQPPVPAGSLTALTVAPPVGRRTGVDYGGRVSGFAYGWDFSMLYLRQTDDTPQFSVAVADQAVVVQPFFSRVHLVGASAANAFSDFAVRGEVGVTFGRGVSRVAPGPSVAPETADAASFVVGLDWYGLSQTFFGIQYFQDTLLGGRSDNRPRTDRIATVAFRRSFANQTVSVSHRTLINLVDGDAQLEAELSYRLRDGLSVFLRGAGFIGDRDGVFGQFRDASRLTVGFTVGL